MIRSPRFSPPPPPAAAPAPATPVAAVMALASVSLLPGAALTIAVPAARTPISIRVVFILLIIIGALPQASRHARLAAQKPGARLLAREPARDRSRSKEPGRR